MTDPQANPRKTTSVRKLGAVDCAALRAAVRDIPESVWDAQNAGKPNRFGALETTRHIVFRFVDGFNDWRRASNRPIWSAWSALLEPVLAQATRDYGYANGAFPRIMLARMAPGGVIKPHRDANPAAKWPHKVHVPLITNPHVHFFVDGVDYRFVQDEAVEVNNLGVHAVENAGATDRIHLIFEYYDLDQPAPDWVESGVDAYR